MGTSSKTLSGLSCSARDGDTTNNRLYLYSGVWCPRMMLVMTSFHLTQSSVISHFQKSDVTKHEIDSLFAVHIGFALASLLIVTIYSGSAFPLAVRPLNYFRCRERTDTGFWTLAWGVLQSPTLPCDFQVALTKSSAYLIREIDCLFAFFVPFQVAAYSFICVSIP